MDGSPSSVISMGWGSWGSSGLTLTLGFGQGAAVAIVEGPYRWTALGSHDPGAAAIGTHTPGATALGLHDAGGIAGTIL